MSQPPNAAERIAARFLQQRASSGRRISIDEVMAEMSGVPNRPATRLSALRLIAERRPTSTGSSGAPTESDQTVELPRIDGYEVIDVIGRGGMGVVYEAYRHSTGRRVAIKFMLERAAGTAEARRRFEREVELVARLQHPAIVSVLDSGLLAGRPYYTMEFIDGRPLDEAIAPGEADVSSVLGLLAKIADAVDFAHQRGVLHRDLKPSNILIDADGRPHILDFGLAKAFDAGSGLGPRMTLSEPGQIIGTIAYMAPEQARGEYEQLSIRSDGYALGAIGYELITGRLPQPIDGPLADVLAAVAQRDPPRPSSLRRGLSADVDAILLKCLEKSPQNRYATAGELAADLRRFLDHRTIIARRAGAAVRAARWVRRNRAVSAVGAASLVIIVSGTVYGFVRVVRERDRANEQRTLAVKRESEARHEKDIADAINEFLTNDLLSAVAPAGERDQGRGKDVKMRDVLDEAARRMDQAFRRGGRFADKPDVVATICNAIGETYLRLGELTRAKPHLHRALDIRRRMLGDEHRLTLISIHDIGALLYAQGKLAEAQAYYREALDKRRRVLGNDHPDTLSSINDMGLLLQSQGKLAEAEPYYREAMERMRRVLGDEHPNTLAAINNLGFLLQAQGKLAEAEPYYREALEKMRRALGDDHPSTLASINNMAFLQQSQGKLAEAETYYREAVEKMRHALGDEHPDTLNSINNLGGVLQYQGKVAEAEGYYREAMEKRRRVLGDEHPDTLISISNVGALLRDQGKLAEAEPYYRETVDKMRRVLDDDHPNTLASIGNMAALLRDQGKLTEAEPYYREALTGYTKKFGPVHWRTANTEMGLGSILRDRSRYAEAQTHLLAAEPVLRSAQGVPAGRYANCVGAVAKLYQKWHAAEPGKGYDAKAAEWRAKLAQLNAPVGATSAPNNAPPSGGQAAARVP